MQLFYVRFHTATESCTDPADEQKKSVKWSQNTCSQSGRSGQGSQLSWNLWYSWNFKIVLKLSWNFSHLVRMSWYWPLLCRRYGIAFILCLVTSSLDSVVISTFGLLTYLVALVTFLWLQYWSDWLIKVCEHRKTCIFCVLSLVKPAKMSWNFTSCSWEHVVESICQRATC